MKQCQADVLSQEVAGDAVVQPLKDLIECLVGFYQVFVMAEIGYYGIGSYLFRGQGYHFFPLTHQGRSQWQRRFGRPHPRPGSLRLNPPYSSSKLLSSSHVSPSVTIPHTYPTR